MNSLYFPGPRFSPLARPSAAPFRTRDAVSASFPPTSKPIAPMSQKSVFAIATTRARAERIVAALQLADFSNNDISVLFPDQATTRDFAHEKNTKAPEGAVAGATTGGVVGGALGWIAGIGALAIPGVGPFIAAGPVIAALSGVAVGATVGGIAGALVGLGIPEIEARRYEGKIQRGNILLSVHANDANRIDEAKRIFDEHGAEDITIAKEIPPPIDANRPAPPRAKL